MTVEHDWLTIPQVAEYLGIGVNTARRLVDRGEVFSVVDRRKRLRRVPKSELDRWVEAHRVKSGDLAHLDQYAPEFGTRHTQRG